MKPNDVIHITFIKANIASFFRCIRQLHIYIIKPLSAFFFNCFFLILNTNAFSQSSLLWRALLIQSFISFFYSPNVHIFILLQNTKKRKKKQRLVIEHVWCYPTWKKKIDFHSYTNTDQLNERGWWTVNNHKNFDIFAKFSIRFFVIFLFHRKRKNKQIHKWNDI